jgi:signal transduction histidine kinase
MLGAGTLTMGAFLLVNIAFGFSPLVFALTFNPYFFLLIMLGICTLIATVLVNGFGHYYLRPLNRLIAATKEVTRGNFKVQVKKEKWKKGKIYVKPPSEMGALEDSFNEMVRELDGIEMFRNDFINNFSHEFKTPIVSIRGFARELQQEDLSEEQRREYAAIITEESDRLARLSTSILELSKLENQQILTDKSEFDLAEQLRRSILLFESEWTKKNIEILPELNEVTLYSSAALTERIWTNLLSNAIKFTPEGGTVSVGLCADEERVTVTVTDNGIGMTEEVREHIFEKFYQGDASHHRTGYGIGLPMVKRAVTLCGGEIDVQSEVGKGSTFTVRLPRKLQ